MTTPTFSLGVTISDIYPHITAIWSAIWPLVAFGLAVLVVPRIVSVVKSSIAAGRSR